MALINTENEKFQITKIDDTNRAIQMAIVQLDRQIAELDAEKSRLQDLRRHMARTIGFNRDGGTRMQQILDSTERAITEGKGADIETELAEETSRVLGDDDDMRPASLAAMAAAGG